ncbi:hypothetical protein D3C87_1266550 [compost metagenome]
MAKPSKIEELKCQDIVASGVKSGKSVRQIAEECSEFAGVEITHMAVDRYIKSPAFVAYRNADTSTRKAIIKQDKRQIIRAVHQDLDLIDLNRRTTKVLVDRFDEAASLPELFESRAEQLGQMIAEGGGQEEFKKWQRDFSVELRRRCLEITALSREIRENGKFMADLREKAFQFTLLTEFLDLFVEVFARESPEACDRALAAISTNPRMQRILEMRASGNWGGGMDAQTG